MNPESLAEFINTYGFGAAIVLFVFYLISRFLIEQGPLILKRYQNRKADDQEHSQTIIEEELRHRKLLDLVDAGNRTYTEEQLTQHLSELYGEFQEVNKFIRDTVSVKLDRVENQLSEIICNTDSIPSVAEKLIGLQKTITALHNRLDEIVETLNESELKSND